MAKLPGDTWSSPAKPANCESLFPVVARCGNGYGYIEIGNQAGFGFVVWVQDYGGVVFEDDNLAPPAAAMADLEQGLAEYFERGDIE